jgi:hypothetical protein
VPYKGQGSAADFKRFSIEKKFLFQKEATKEHLYR